jgi:CheY-like chemotaxis protein
MFARFVSWLALGVASGFLVVASTAFARFDISNVALGVGIGILVVSLFLAYRYRHSASTVATALANAIVSAWTIVASQAFGLGEVQNLTLAGGLALAALAAIGLTVDELSSEEVVHSPEVKAGGEPTTARSGQAARWRPRVHGTCNNRLRPVTAPGSRGARRSPPRTGAPGSDRPSHHCHGPMTLNRTHALGASASDRLLQRVRTILNDGKRGAKLDEDGHEHPRRQCSERYPAARGQRTPMPVAGSSKLPLTAMCPGRCRGTLVGMRCVIVDDNPVFLEAAGALLERQGIAVAAMASTATEALRETDAARPDVVLVDISLGDESGVALARRLVERLCGKVPVILISTRAGEEVVELLSACRAAAFLPKPQLSAEAIRRIVADHAGANPTPET